MQKSTLYSSKTVGKNTVAFYLESYNISGKTHTVVGKFRKSHIKDNFKCILNEKVAKVMEAVRIT